MTPLKLSDDQLSAVFAAARPLALEDRDAFLQEVAARLSSLPHLGDGVVFQVCREIQRKHFDPPIGDLGPPSRKYEQQPRKAAG